MMSAMEITPDQTAGQWGPQNTDCILLIGPSKTPYNLHKHVLASCSSYISHKLTRLEQQHEHELHHHDHHHHTQDGAHELHEHEHHHHHAHDHHHHHRSHHNEHGTPTIHLPAISIATMDLIVEYIYSGHLPDSAISISTKVSYDITLHLWQGAHHLGVANLQSKIQKEVSAALSGFLPETCTGPDSYEYKKQQDILYFLNLIHANGGEISKTGLQNYVCSYMSADKEVKGLFKKLVMELEGADGRFMKHLVVCLVGEVQEIEMEDAAGGHKGVQGHEGAGFASMGTWWRN